MGTKRGPRKLLVASVGVATINYVIAGTGCGSTVANLPAPSAGQTSGGAAGSSGATSNGGSSAGTTSNGGAGFPTVANLPAPISGSGGSR